MKNNYEKMKRNFHDNGFVVIRKLISKKQIKKILEEIPKILNKATKIKDKKTFHRTKDGKVNTIHNINKFYKKGYINKTITKKISTIAEKILTKKVKLRNIEFFLKPKKTGMISPFHQDNYYWNIINSEACNCWLSCTKSNKKNGGMCYYESSNMLGTIKHEVSLAPGSSQKIPLKILKKLKFNKVFPSLNVGDCIIHHPEVIHGSYENKSNLDRIGLVSSFKTVNARMDREGLKRYKRNLSKNIKKIYK